MAQSILPIKADPLDLDIFAIVIRIFSGKLMAMPCRPRLWVLRIASPCFELTVWWTGGILTSCCLVKQVLATELPSPSSLPSGFDMMIRLLRLLVVGLTLMI